MELLSATVAAFPSFIFDASATKILPGKMLLLASRLSLGRAAIPLWRNLCLWYGIHPSGRPDGGHHTTGTDGHDRWPRWWYIPEEFVSARDDVLSPNQQVGQEKTMADNEAGTSGLGWFLAGLGIGTLIGVLYAPKAGKETREDIVNSAMEAKEKAAVLVEQGRQKANEYVEQGKQYVEQGRQKAAELVEQGKQQAKESVDKGREYYEKGRTQWTQYAEKGKGLLNEQQAKVGAAVEAGKEAYVNTTVETPV
jgi:gas vesicle protein